MRERLKGMVMGILITTLLLGTVTAFATVPRTIEVTVGNVRTTLFGQEFVVRNDQGVIIEPFTYNGVVYVPVDTIIHAMGENVQWNESTGTLNFGAAYIGHTAPAAQTTVTTLFNSPYAEVGNAAWFVAWGDTDSNVVRLMTNRNSWSRAETRSNFVVYNLDGALNTTFAGTILQPTSNSIEMIYRIYGNGRLLYTSPIMRNNTEPTPFEVDVSGVQELRIEVDVTNLRISTVAADNSFGAHNQRLNGGIQNATIITTR